MKSTIWYDCVLGVFVVSAMVFEGSWAGRTVDKFSEPSAWEPWRENLREVKEEGEDE